MKNPKTSRSGFTLIELLTVIAIIGILAAVLIPTVGIVQQKAQQASSSANMKSIYNAHQMYQTTGSRSRSLANGNWTTQNPNKASNPADFAKALAWYADLNEAQLYYITSAADVSTLSVIPRVIFRGSGSNRSVDPEFTDAEKVISYEMARIVPNSKATTPLIWTKGLQEDGTWDPNPELSPWGDAGGHILFSAGNVEFFKTQIESGQLRQPDGDPTNNIEECFTSTDRILRVRN